MSADASIAPAVASVVAGLPLSLAWSTGHADVYAIDGAAPGWAARAAAAAAAGARGVLVVHPTPVAAAELDALDASLTHTCAVLDWAYAADPATALLRTWRATGPGVLECTSYAPLGADVDRELLEVVAWLLRAFGRTPAVLTRHRLLHGERAVGRLALIDGAESALLIRIVMTDAVPPALVVTWAGATQRLNARVFPPDTARPARVTLTDAKGDTTLPAVYESAHRTSWKRLLTFSGRPAHGDLADLRRCLAVLR
ncbi:hypothetical protein E1212_15140 [Jiangella ureilytica]|uniref:Uncharacterized protein n=1 Tax=Jiangella ureilytica TaxID=2530374 RepID=A0A4R4RMT5_9ACTN|nr:hypothetical protein E1212_15140 [Jiangella ureilytica]